MGGSTLTHAWAESESAVAADTWSRADSPGIRLLDALRGRDDEAVLELCGETTTVEAPAMGWSCTGTDQIERMLAEARAFFPGLTIEPRTRNLGFGLVIDEVRVQDAWEPVDGEASPEEPGAGSGDGTPQAHPMWDDEPVSTQRALAVWREDFLTPMRLNLPVRVTVRHDDLQVHEVVLEFPAALLKRALGMYVDPLEMSLGELQSAVIAPVEAGFTTRTLAVPGAAALPVALEPVEDRTEVVESPGAHRRRRRVLVPALVGVVGVAAAAGWWVVQERSPHAAAVSPAALTAPAPSPLAQTSSQPSSQPSAQVSTNPAKAPVVTHAKPSDTPSGKPNVTLKSDLAFGFDSASLSPQAKKAIDRLADQVRAAELTGKIYVDGYTDDLGSNAHGLVLSQQRADAVSHYLGSRLVGVQVTIVSTGHGEAKPVASNKTGAGRRANRRVTITLPS